MGFGRVRKHTHVYPSAIFVSTVSWGRCDQMSHTDQHDVMSERLPLLCALRSVMIQIAVSRDDKACVGILKPKCRRASSPHFHGSTRILGIPFLLLLWARFTRRQRFVNQVLLATVQLVAFFIKFHIGLRYRHV